MPEQMTKQDAIEYLLYMKHNVQAKSPMDIALDKAIKALRQPTFVCVQDDFTICPKEISCNDIMCGGECCEKP